MRRLIAVIRAAALRFSQDGGAFFAQAIAFNALFAIFPLVILIIAVLGYLYGATDSETRALALIKSLAPSVQPILMENLQHVVAFRGISGVIALVALVWSGKNLFQGLAYALNRALGIAQGRPLLSDILVAIVMLPILGVVFLVATTVPLAISFVVTYGGFRYAAVWTQLAGYGAAILLVFVVTMILYTYLPNRRLKLSFGVPGAVFTTIAWEIAQIAFAIYSTHVDYRHIYGALAAVAILLVWFYYMATIFLFGAQLSAQWLAYEPVPAREARSERSARESGAAERSA